MVEKLCLNLSTVHHKFSIVAISKTWTDLSSESRVAIPGYNNMIKSRVGKRGGGVALFFDNDLDIKIKPRPDLECKDSTVSESLFVQISQPLLKVKDIIIGVVYRLPGVKSDSFYDCFFPSIDKISQEKTSMLHTR